MSLRIYEPASTLHSSEQTILTRASLPQSQRGLLSPARRAAVPTPKRTRKRLGVRKGTAWVSIRQPIPKNHLSAAAASETPAPRHRNPNSGGQPSPALLRGLKGFRGAG